MLITPEGCAGGSALGNGQAYRIRNTGENYTIPSVKMIMSEACRFRLWEDGLDKAACYQRLLEADVL